MSILLNLFQIIVLILLIEIHTNLKVTTEILRLYNTSYDTRADSSKPLHNETMYPLTGTNPKQGDLNSLTKPVLVNDSAVTANTQNNKEPLHNGKTQLQIKGGKS